MVGRFTSVEDENILTCTTVSKALMGISEMGAAGGRPLSCGKHVHSKLICGSGGGVADSMALEPQFLVLSVKFYQRKQYAFCDKATRALTTVASSR